MPNNKVIISQSILNDIANAIKTKTGMGEQEKIKPINMANTISSISGEVHLPIAVNITQSEHQTITVTPVNINNASATGTSIPVPNSVTLNATIVAEEGYTVGTLNQSNVTANWGDTVSFSATPATAITFDFTLPATTNQTITLSYTEPGESLVTIISTSNTQVINMKYGTNWTATISAASGYIPGTLSASSGTVTSATTISATDAIAVNLQLTISRNGSSNNSIIISNTGNLTLYDVIVNCTNNGTSITYGSIIPGEDKIITLNNLIYTFETVSIEATSTDPENLDYELEQTIYFDPTVVDLDNYLNTTLNGSYRQSSTLPDSVIKELTNKIITNVGPGAFGSTVYIEEEGPDYDNSETYSNLTTLSGVEKTWNMSQLTSIQCMFCGCSNLHDIDISNWNVSNVIDMSHFLNACYLSSIDVSNWNTNSVQNMGLMFAFNMFTSLDLSNWNTSNVTNMISLFEACDDLQILDMSNWDTRNIIDSPNSNTYYLPTGMSQMFVGCNSLQYLIIGSEEFKFVMKDGDIGNLNNTCKILVPSALLNTYKTATNWSSRASQFYAIENYTITHLNGQVTVTSNS